jgi:hypothetical protein
MEGKPRYLSFNDFVKISSSSHTRPSAKESWDALTDLFIGNASIQESKFDEEHNEADNFAMLDGEDPQELHRSLSSLQVKLIDLGSTQCDWRWMKRKFVQALLPFMKDTINSIKGDANYRKMTHMTSCKRLLQGRLPRKLWMMLLLVHEVFVLLTLL